MKTHNAKQRIKATYTMLPLIGCPGAEGASWALPADADSYERMVRQMTRPWMTGRYQTTPEMIRASLRAIGITAPKKGRK